MTIVLVHGNPETPAIWDDLVPHLRDDDVVRLSPPGFGSAIPSGFDCSTDDYRDWLAGELGKLHNRSISWGMTGVGGTSSGSRWSVQA
jgi:pimeloyl-ACP methyl ester carboxylesterase